MLQVPRDIMLAPRTSGILTPRSPRVTEQSVKICKHSTLILDVRKWRWLVCWCWVGHFSFPPNPDWFLSTSSPAQPSPAQPSPAQPCPTLPVAACCLLLCGQVVTVQCPVSGYNVHTIYTIYTIYTLHSRCATTAASLPVRAAQLLYSLTKLYVSIVHSRRIKISLFHYSMIHRDHR